MHICSFVLTWRSPPYHVTCNLILDDVSLWVLECIILFESHICISRLALTLTCTMMLQFYPFDSQTCSIIIQSCKYYHGVQRRVISVVIFSGIFEIIIFALLLLYVT